MNVLFFLIPKKQVEYIFADQTIRQVLETVRQHHYRDIPVLNRDGTFFGSLSDTDLLQEILKHNLSLKQCEERLIKDITISRPVRPIDINKDMSELLQMIAEQNYVPVVDDRGDFIGLVTRRAIIQYFRQTYLGTKME